MASPKKRRGGLVTPRAADTGFIPVETGNEAPREVTAPLALSITRDGVGLELLSPWPLGPLRVTRVDASLPGVRFPVDVSGGLSRFRHRRGRLHTIEVTLPFRAFESYAASRLAGLAAENAPLVSVRAREGGLSLTVAFVRSNRGELPPVLAFDLLLRAVGDDVIVYPAFARGVGLVSPAWTLAERATHALLPFAKATAGSRFFVSTPALRVARSLFPDAGVRVPSSDGLRLHAFSAIEGELVFFFAEGKEPLATPPDTVRAEETARLVDLVPSADTSTEDLRASIVEALGRAPRHPALCLRLAEVDACLLDTTSPIHAEVALGALRSAHVKPLAGGLEAELVARARHDENVASTFAVAGERDPSALLSAVCFAMAAKFTDDSALALTWLDEGAARAPGLFAVRLARAAAFVRIGRLAEAHAEVLALSLLIPGDDSGALLRLRFAAGRMFEDAGAIDDAVAELEAALPLSPSDPATLTALGRSLLRTGRITRAAQVLELAIDVGASDEASVLLARALLASGDAPLAVARLRAVPDGSPVATDARLLEAQARIDLEDFAAASLAYARLRAGAEATRDPAAVPALVSAARYEADRGELRLAEAHLECALMIDRANREALALSRELIAKRAAKVGHLPTFERIVRVEDHPPVAQSDPPSNATTTFDLPADDSAAEARADELAGRLRGEPRNAALLAELSTLLLHLGRDHELFALLMARRDEADDREREALLPTIRVALGRLAAKAREDGRELEAKLFDDAREGL